MSALKNSIKLILLISACAGAYYYVHSHHIDLKALFTSSCDCCHGNTGCTIDNKPSNASPISEAASKETSTVIESEPARIEPNIETNLKAESIKDAMPTAKEIADANQTSNTAKVPDFDSVNRPIITEPKNS